MSTIVDPPKKGLARQKAPNIFKNMWLAEPKILIHTQIHDLDLGTAECTKP
jgi:hypothetical protein